MIKSRFIAITLVLVLGVVEGIMAANHPLEFINLGPQLSNANRARKAYPGIPYNVRAAVIGGAYPFLYDLTQAPDGMTANPNTGEVNWPDPQESATVTLRVTDMEGTSVSATWAITVTASGFLFIDASAADGGTGTLASPFNDINDFYKSNSSDSTYAGYFLYFRTGTYVLSTSDSYLGSNEIGLRLSCNASRKPVVWMAYPGDSPIIDCELRKNIFCQGDNLWFDGGTMIFGDATFFWLALNIPEAKFVDANDTFLGEVEQATFTIRQHVTPEPATFVLAALALLGIGCRWGKRV